MQFFKKITQALGKTTANLGTWLRGGVVDEAFLEALGDTLLQADVGLPATERLLEAVRRQAKGRQIESPELEAILAAEITALLAPLAQPLALGPAKPFVLLVVGVNGSGKTTTIGKLAYQWRRAGKTVQVAAADTYRAGAVQQLAQWAEQADVAITLPEREGADPAGVAYQGYEAAVAAGADVLIVDTAGRLQNRADLMEQLGKIKRVLGKQNPAMPQATVLVLDATVGQNALQQVRGFNDVTALSGLILTKLDSSAKGGVLLALAAEFDLPVHYLGLGEQADDLQPFDATDFAKALLQHQ